MSMPNTRFRRHADSILSFVPRGCERDRQGLDPIDTDEVLERASWVTPVPGGVGPVTVGMLVRNALVAHERLRAAGR